jgi:hypothetical protein
MHLVGMDTLLILLSLGQGNHHPRAQDITKSAPDVYSYQPAVLVFFKIITPRS